MANPTKNSLVQSKPKFSSFVRQENVQKMILEVVGGKDKDRFVTSIVSAVSINPALSDCEFSTIVSAALLGQALNLSPSPQLGQYYMVPYNDRDRGKVAQFQMGYKGYIQLAMRSGQYKKLNVLDIKEGELKHFDPLNEDIEAMLIEDPEARENAQTVGYYAMFELVNGFRKTLYWSKGKMKAHAKKYSQGYASDLRNNKQYTFWSKDFDGMAFKTMLRQLISKWGPTSIEMQSAFESDMGVVTDNGQITYVDNEPLDDSPPVYETTAEEATEPNPDDSNEELTEDQMADLFFSQQGG